MTVTGILCRVSNMANNYFRFKQFTIIQELSAFKVGTDGVMLGAYADFKGAKRILDIGTGTGLLAIMAAQRTDAEIVAIEPDENSFAEAYSNAGGSKWKERITIKNFRFQEFSFSHPEPFDVIISNPPYFRDSLKNPEEIKSLTRHSDSLSASEILEGVGDLLNQGGSLQLILPYVEGTLFIAEASRYGFYCTRIFKIRPVPTGEIKRLILKFEREKKPVTEKFLTIETGIRHQYTQEYKEATKDFYLD
jgi:tRNA1Val (adenine37-N6)-methyltransferase